MNLFKLSQNYMQVIHMVEELDEETLKDTLDSINESIELKVENTAYVIKTLEANSKAYKDEMDRMAKSKKTIDNNIKNLKLYMQQAMEQTGMDKIEGKLIKVSIQNNPPSVYVTQEESLKEYMVEQPKKLDKRALLDDLKQGVEVAGAELQQTRSVRIK